MASGVDLHEFVAGFVLEAEEHLHSANRNLVTVSDGLKAGRSEPRAVRELFRSLHTIKGLASMVEATPVVDISHEMEGILRTADRAGGAITEEALNLLVKGTRVIEERIKSIPKFGVSGIPKAPSKLLEDLMHFQRKEKPQASASRTRELDLPEEILRSLAASDREQALQGVSQNRKLFLLDFEPSPENMASGLNITSVRDRISKIAEIIKVVPHSAAQSPTGIAFWLLILTDSEVSHIATAVGVLEAHFSAVPIKDSAVANDLAPVENLPFDDEPPESESSGADEKSSSIRVDIRKLDEVLERLSDLIITRSRLSNIVASLTARDVDTRELNAVIAENGRQLKRLRTAITEARMVPLAELLQRLPLVVRGLTQDPDKAVNIFIQAGSSEVDKAVADKIFPAIVHIIRNAVDHALETKCARRLAGKDETGVITVTCDDSAGTLLSVTIKDDGGGIDREAVARKARQPVAKTNEELLRQICSPGLSTREDASLTSGRGMGMDIVRKTIETLGGSVTLSTEEGKGTTFVLRVPVSITIVDVISFISGGQVFVAPVAMIDEIVEIDPARLPLAPSVTKSGPQARLLNRRGETIPYLVLDSILNGHADSSVPLRALVVNQLHGAVAFGVDRMLGQQEVVIRPIDEHLMRAKGMSGATDLGDGRPTLVVDLTTLGAEFAMATR